MVDEMTSDTKRLLVSLYREYIQKRKNGKSRSDAAYFGGVNNIRSFFSANIEDIAESCRELENLGYLSCLHADNMPCEVVMTSAGISAMEHRFPDGIKSVLEFLAQFIP